MSGEGDQEMMRNTSQPIQTDKSFSQAIIDIKLAYTALSI